MLDRDHDARIVASQQIAHITIELIQTSKKTMRYFRTAISQTERKISSSKELLRTQEDNDQES